jgi:hypothetical protein
MRAIVIATGFSLLISAYASHAGCSYLADSCSDGLCVDISDQGCTKKQLTLAIWKYHSTTNTQGEVLPYFPVPGTRIEVPFDEHCSLSDDWKVFRCKRSGNTILAGRTYMLVARGKISCDDIDTGKPVSSPGKTFICTRGCTKTSPLRYIDANTEACH